MYNCLIPYTPYLICQIVEMNNVAHHPDRLVKGTELVISITNTKENNIRETTSKNTSMSHDISKLTI